MDTKTITKQCTSTINQNLYHTMYIKPAPYHASTMYQNLYHTMYINLYHTIHINHLH
jgi:hypothetical protein